MKNRKYKFSIDEAAPQIPPAADFNAMLIKAKSHIPWYSKLSVLGGAATAVVAGIVAWVYVGPQTHQPKLAKAEVFEAIPSPITQTEDTLSDLEHATNPFRITEVAREEQQFAGLRVFETPNDSAFEFRLSVPQQAPMNEMLSTAHSNQIAPWNIDCPFDSIMVDMAQLPARFALRNFGYLWIQKSSFVDKQGNAATGKIKLLYRDIRDAAAMIVCQTLIDEAGTAIPNNNGAFELQIANAAIEINEEAPLYLSFLPNKKVKNNQGFKKTQGAEWQLLAEAGLTNNRIQEDGERNIAIDSIPSRLNFWQFMVSIFTGKDMHTYDVYEHPEFGNQEGLGKESMENGLRTYEIREFGHYANGWMQDEQKRQARTVRVKSYHNDAFQPIVYQVFAGENRVRKVIPDSTGNIQLEFTSKDRCYLMIPLKNKQKFAVYDANSFDRVVKYGTQKQIVVRTQAAEIKRIDDLRAFMRKYESQKLPGK